ncbi:hypothetical protein [Thermospira aquatica]|uniref:DUF4129 domain-containing protein n=1 Tax=Thermospira aquatica TaxID=2828656 RepID=A0AAX3BDM9_9SPIR|nr:hypothetical protein [Thermospira aquatica]URA10355.1 hypothetical protein KDW03_00695 [Thermospira aquatica]
MWWWLWLLLPLFPANEVPIGESFEVVYPVTGKVLTYEFEGDLSPFVLLQSVERTNGLRFSLRHFSLSNVVFPPVRVISFSQGDTNIVRFEGWVLRVAPTNIGVSQLQDLAPIYFFTDYTWLLWLFLILVLVFGIVWWWKNRGKTHQEETSSFAEETLEEAFQHLRQALDILGEKEYYSEVAYLLRRVLEKAYDFPAREMASREIGVRIVATGELKELILDVLKWCDRVKYAKHITSEAKRREILEQLEEIYKELILSKEEKP